LPQIKTGQKAMNAQTIWGYDVPGSNAVIIGDVEPVVPTWQAIDSQTGNAVNFRTKGENRADCLKQAREFFTRKGGRQTWPDGLEIRTWNA
jgi:hypothetical protein